MPHLLILWTCEVVGVGLTCQIQMVEVKVAWSTVNLDTSSCIQRWWPRCRCWKLEMSGEWQLVRLDFFFGLGNWPMKTSPEVSSWNFCCQIRCTCAQYSNQQVLCSYCITRTHTSQLRSCTCWGPSRWLFREWSVPEASTWPFHHSSKAPERASSDIERSWW